MVRYDSIDLLSFIGMMMMMMMMMMMTMMMMMMMKMMMMMMMKMMMMTSTGGSTLPRAALSLSLKTQAGNFFEIVFLICTHHYHQNRTISSHHEEVEQPWSVS